MRAHLVLIKLGGSLITDKGKPYTIREQNIAFFAAELRTLYQDQAVDLLIGNGAGSFGHFTAHQYGLREGAQNAEQLYGMCVTHNGVQRLNSAVAAKLTGQNIPAFSLSPASLLLCSDERIVSSYLEPIKSLLLKKIVPVVHGDTICDNKRGTTILSTEEVLYTCLQEFRADYKRITVIYALDVDGLLDENGALVPELKTEDDFVTHHVANHDVTRGIVGKIASARKAAQLADAVYLINGKTPDALRKAIAHQAVGTRVR